MTLWLYAQCIIFFFCGQLLHLFWLKIPALKKRAAAAKRPFSLKEYYKADWHIMAGTQIAGAMLILGIDELTHWKPEILDAVKFFFGGFGAFGSSVMMNKLSVYEKRLLSVIDIKSGVADDQTAKEALISDGEEVDDGNNPPPGKKRPDIP